jgi:tRNA(Arg) A34 adenosine deaminase TadA
MQNKQENNNGRNLDPNLDPMALAMDAASKAALRGEVPVGAVIVNSLTGEVLAVEGNRTMELRDPTAHAEMLVIRNAAKSLASERLVNCDLYVTLEPCPMCAQAISFARIRRLYYGASDAKGGGVDNGARIFAAPSCHHKPEVYSGIREAAAAEMLRSFFENKR